MRHGQEQGWGSAEFEGGRKVHLQTDLPTCLTCATSLARTNVATVLVLRTYLPTYLHVVVVVWPVCLSACLLPASFLRRITTNITNIPLSLPPSTQ